MSASEGAAPGLDDPDGHVELGGEGAGVVADGGLGEGDLLVVEECACDSLVDPALDGGGLVSVVVEVGVGHLVQEDGDGLPVGQAGSEVDGA